MTQLDVLDHVQTDAVGIVDIAVGVAQGHHLGAQSHGLLRSEDGHVAAAGDDHGLAGEAVVLHALEHLGGQVAKTVAGGLGTGQGAAVGQALAGEDTRLVGVAQAAILAEQIADLTGAHADVAGGHVGELADVTVELGHEALAKTHDLSVALALGIEVAAALAAADGQTGEAVLQDLLEAQELQDGQVDGGMEPQAALIGADGGVELDTVAAVDLHLALVIYPGHPEAHHALGLHEGLDDAVGLVLGVFIHNEIQALQDFQDGLVELFLIGVPGDDLGVYPLQILAVQHNHYPFLCSFMRILRL